MPPGRAGPCVPTARATRLKSLPHKPFQGHDRSRREQQMRILRDTSVLAAHLRAVARTRWFALTGISVLAAAFALLPTTPAAAATQYTFFHFNMAGNMNHGGHSDFIVPAVRDSITNNWPTAVSLNEVCENQFAEIYWDINARGGNYTGHFSEILPAPQTLPNGHKDDWCDGHRYGLALFIRGTDLRFDESKLNPIVDRGKSDQLRNEQRWVICGTARGDSAPRLEVCSAHLFGGDLKFVQMDQIADEHLFPAVRRGAAVAFMGDTYLDADAMVQHTGGLFEHTVRGNTFPNPDCHTTQWTRWSRKDIAAHCPGKPTRQNDHVMVSVNRARDIGGAITHSDWSDHIPVRGHATFD
ncbi:hypothetical protein [Nocardia blacklockiae]|uniref:hypothetical protein n=1 Tax=Nocardia blacklockiae TaxID=480036 RepID=UPI0018933064|nr:hypothetical protein [Nocardia blacklockiae]MBF6173143.1 hypothetical protein [Nocardia blacklockiae]